MTSYLAKGGVRCLNTKETFKTAAEAARAFGLTPGAVRYSAYKGRPVSEAEYWFEYVNDTPEQLIERAYFGCKSHG